MNKITKLKTRSRAKYANPFAGVERVKLQTHLVAPLDAAIDVRLEELNEERNKKGLKPFNKTMFINVALRDYDARMRDVFNQCVDAYNNQNNAEKH